MVFSRRRLAGRIRQEQFAGGFDRPGEGGFCQGVKFTEAKRHFIAAFHQNPLTPAPKIRVGTVVGFHEWKAEMRGYDAAQMALRLATPEEIQARNTAIMTARGGGRIVRHAPYA